MLCGFFSKTKNLNFKSGTTVRERGEEVGKNKMKNEENYMNGNKKLNLTICYLILTNLCDVTTSEMLR